MVTLYVHGHIFLLPGHKLFIEAGVDLCLDLWLSVLAFKYRQEGTPMMTDQQKQEIESLRKEGLSYRQIAERVGATHACIITYFHRKRIRDTTRLLSLP